MDALLKWAILNGATASEDAPQRDAATEAEIKKKKLDPAVIDAILGKPASVQMSECLDAAEHADTPLSAREIALDDLEMLVENIDNASNLGPLNLWPRIVQLYTDKESSIRAAALWISGTAVQHNPHAQKVFPGLAAALKVLRNTEEEKTVRAKALYCVSSFVRANAAGLTQFVRDEGLEALVEVAKENDAVLQQKAFFLMRALVDEAIDEETPEELRPGRYLIDAMVELGAVDAAANAVTQMTTANEPTAFEQVLAFLNAVADATERGADAVKESKGVRFALSKASEVFGDWAGEDITRIIG
ncbi:hsp70 nucleotide exchange factor fes1 [Coemansia sp. RSA 2703]|nr:hsp70 nucleotide exchange factor fes1 [Coemansia sp. RSA 2703]KAJ2365884.1 hsp70 nucleotide exchange factor fes1 [Coemansia sp. RSA 2607]KAJ2385744.1 hsp70 nucleotide exchange factor fes1 [Coemansia sp. RSA 2603]